MAKRIPEIDQSSFDSLTGLVLVDFQAEWCGPCRTMEPVLESLATEYAGRARIVSVDVDREPALAQRFDVRSMPTFVLLRDGREVGRIVGSRPRRFVAGVLERGLAGDVAIASP